MATAPTFTPSEVAVAQQFFASNPTGAQIYEKASEIGLSPEQVAGLYQQSMGGDYGNVLNTVNSYLNETGQSLAGGYPGGLLNTTSGGSNVVSGGGSAPSITWTPSELDAARSFFSLNPTPDQIYSKGLEYDLTPSQLASLYTSSMGGDYNNIYNAVTSYLNQTGQKLGGGYQPAKTIPTNQSVSISQAQPVTREVAAIPAMPTISGEDYFSRYFPVTVTGGQANPSAALNNVSGQLGLDTILANIQGQYTPQTFTHSGGSYGAGRFIRDFGQPSGAGSVGGGIIQPTFQPGEFDINDYINADSGDKTDTLTEEELGTGTGSSGNAGESLTTGGSGGGGTPGGQGVSNTGINAALNAKALLDPLGKISLLAKIAGYGVDKYLDSQIDAISESFDVLAGNDVEKTGMYTIVDKQGNVYKISNDDSIAAQLASIFGTQPGASTADPSPVELGMTPSPAEGGAYVDGAPAPAPAPVYTAEQLNNIQTFWDSKPTTDQILEAIEINKLTPEQAAETWAIATGGDKQVGLNIFNEYMAANPDRAPSAIQPETVYDARLDQSSTQYDPAFYNRVTAGLSGGGGTVGSGNISGGFVPVGLLNTGVVVGGPITGGLSQTTPLGPLSGGNSSLTSGWTTSDWSRDYTSEFGG